jgi:hypothetical protein
MYKLSTKSFITQALVAKTFAHAFKSVRMTLISQQFAMAPRRDCLAIRQDMFCFPLVSLLVNN